MILIGIAVPYIVLKQYRMQKFNIRNNYKLELMRKKAVSPTWMIYSQICFLLILKNLTILHHNR